MSAIIVALSNSEVTTRAVLVFVLAIIAIFLVARRPTGSSPSQGNGHSRQPIYVRVDQRAQPLYEPPQPSRRVISSGSLLAAVAVGGAVVAFVIAYVISVLVGSVTSLLR